MTSEELQKSFHYLYPDELPALKGLAKLGEKDGAFRVVNIGAGAGTSGLAFLESHPNTILYTIDIQDESSPLGCLEAERQVCHASGLRLLGERHFQFHADSKEIAAAWVGGLVDLVFIDGDHSYEGCKGDIVGWLPHIRLDGLIAVHDYRKGDLEVNPNGPHPQPWPGVDRAVDEYLRPYYQIELWVDSLIVFRV